MPGNEVLAKGVTGYSNFVLKNEVQDALESKLNLSRFCTLEKELENAAGMTVKINRYISTGAAEKLKKGEGNSKAVGVSILPFQYEIECTQTKFEWNDEDKMEDPMVVPVGMKQVAADMVNTMNADVYGEMKKATRVIVTDAISFDDFVDAQSLIASEEEKAEGTETFALVHPRDVAALRIALKGSLEFVKEYVLGDNSYIGTIGGTNIYKKKNATRGIITLGTKKAVSIFPKPGIGMDQYRDGDHRFNRVNARKYYVAALRHDVEAAVIFHGSVKPSEDSEVQAEKKYYKLADGDTYYEQVLEPKGNPSTSSYLELVPAKAAAAAASVQAESKTVKTK